MTTWITDDNGNRASVQRWGSELAARAALATLTDCTDCTDCANCRYCRYCTNCTNCTNCRYCTACTNCTDCRYCNLTCPHVRVPVSDPRGYTWLAIVEGGGVCIRAGCRNFAPVDALQHWGAPTYGGPETVKQTATAGIRWAVGYLEAMQ